MLLDTIAPGKGTLLSLANKARAYNTSVWERLLSLGLLRTDRPFSFECGQLEAAARAPTILVGLLSDRRVTLGCMPLNGHGNGNWWDWKDGDDRPVRDSHGKEAL